MIDFKIDESKCIECGLCAKECPVRIIAMEPKPVIRNGKEKNCLRCQHCLAVCPTGALSILGKKPEDSVTVAGEMPSNEAMTRLIKTRRSVRVYKDESIDRKVIHELLDTAAYAPTGHNKNAVHFHVIDTPDAMNSFRQKVYLALNEASNAGKLTGSHEFLNGIQHLWMTKGIDIIFRNAPHLVIASAPNKITSPKADCLISMSYFELLANTNGIGTLWNGMIQFALDEIAPELRKAIGIPVDHAIGYALLFGKPAVKYARGIQSEGLHVNYVNID
ncbi:4Fe-4S dicluster domain-containing protein [Puteibacter caeruleilacunae]|nr:4Fe-4S dicluster domain-containing protein [Puteibacter caeruleilacunae]